MIKRQVLTTVEVLSKPIQGRKKTHFVTGYVHKPYPPVYADLAREAGFDTACIVRGVEGGVIPSLRQTGKYFHYHDRGAEAPGQQRRRGLERAPGNHRPSARRRSRSSPFVPAQAGTQSRGH